MILEEPCLCREQLVCSTYTDLKLLLARGCLDLQTKEQIRVYISTQHNGI